MPGGGGPIAASGGEIERRKAAVAEQVQDFTRTACSERSQLRKPVLKSVAERYAGLTSLLVPFSLLSLQLSFISLSRRVRLYLPEPSRASRFCRHSDFLSLTFSCLS